MFMNSYLNNHNREEIKRSFDQIDDIDNIIQRIDDLQNKGVLLPGPVEQLISTEPQDIKELVKYNMENILKDFIL